jgi:hypothetical protein
VAADDFFLSLLDRQSAVDFVRWAEGHLDEQTDVFRQRFNPAVRGLAAAIQGQPPTDGGRRVFLGWSKERHWLSPEGTRELAKG